MGFDLTGLGSIFDLGSKLVDKLIPDPAQKDAAKLQLMQLQQSGELQEMQTSMSAILAEEQSEDKWTSRARPSFMYVIYILILSSIPMAVIYALSPETAKSLIDGFHAWLNAIPESYLQLFGVGYLGYTGGRSWEKVKGVTK